jgi:peptide/nickel transport system ATP-binding protein
VETIAVDDVCLQIDSGEFVALVGESGSGKTTLGLAIMGLRTLGAGRILVDGCEFAVRRRRDRRELARRAQFLFQNPYDSLDPRWRVQQIVEEPLRIHSGSVQKRQRHEAVADALTRVQLTPPQEFGSRRPGELSGGQRQRAAIAAALVIRPQLLIADEPVSMLDATVQGSILALLRSLCDDGLAILMITHDLASAARYADRVAVMKNGRIVEQGDASGVFSSPRDPYTKRLLEAVPRLPADAAVSLHHDL